MSDNVSTTNTTGGDGLPEWARKELSETRSEAAARRVEARDYKDKLDAATGQVQTLTTEKDQATTRAETAELNLLKVTVAVQAGVPGGDIADFVDLLQGSTADELKASAEKVLKFRQPAGSQPAYDPSQGRGGNPPANVPNTPEAQFLQWFSGTQGVPIS